MRGDIEEEYHRRVTDGRVRAALWRWYQLLGLVIAYRRPTRDAPRTTHSTPPTVVTLVESWFRDVRFGFRMLIREPVVTMTVVVTLALGIGATTTMFSIANGLLRNLPVPDPHELVAIAIRDLEQGAGDGEVPGSYFVEWRSAQTTMVDLAAYRREGFQVSATGARPQRYEGAAITPGSFSLLGVEPARGREFVVSDFVATARPVIIAHRIWRDLFDLAPDALGATLRVDGTVRTVVGIMPEGFGFPRLEYLWIPLRTDGMQAAGNVELFGRLAPTASLEEARVEFATLGQRTFRASMPVRETHTVEIIPYRHKAVGSDAPMLLYTMVALVSLVLVIACANVTNVLLARSTTRRREVAVRAALGGSRVRLMRQFLTETMMLSVLGGVGGVWLASAAVGWFDTTLQDRISIFWITVAVDRTVLLFACGLTGIATMLAGLAPALKASRVDVVSGIKDGAGGVSSRRVGRMTGALVMGEIALTCVLLVACGLMVKGVVGLASRDLAFDRAELLTGRVQLGAFDYPDADAVRGFYTSLAQRWANHGGGELAITSRLPGRQSGRWHFGLEGRAYERIQDMPTASLRRVEPGFFSMLGILPIAGRLLDERDHPDGLPTVVVNTTFADRFFPDGAVGRRIRVGGPESENPWREVVGVVDDRGATLEESRAFPGFFIPVTQSPMRTLELIVRDPGGESGSAAALFEVIATIDPNLPLYAVASLDAVLRDEILPQQTMARLFAGFGLAGLLLATVGLYGTMAFAVTQRAREIGLRRALGATVPHVIVQTLRAAGLQLAVGLGVGIGLAVFVAPAVGEFTFGADPRDLVVFTVVPSLLAVTAIVAAWIPSRRAAKIEPMQVLRYE